MKFFMSCKQLLELQHLTVFQNFTIRYQISGPLVRSHDQHETDFVTKSYKSQSVFASVTDHVIHHVIQREIQSF